MSPVFTFEALRDFSFFCYSALLLLCSILSWSVRKSQKWHFSIAKHDTSLNLLNVILENNWHFEVRRVENRAKMAMGKSYKLFHKNAGSGPYSVLLEQRNRSEALLFESLVIAALGMLYSSKIRFQKSIFLVASFRSCGSRIGEKILHQATGCLWLPWRASH